MIASTTSSPVPIIGGAQIDIRNIPYQITLIPENAKLCGATEITFDANGKKIKEELITCYFDAPPTHPPGYVPQLHTDGFRHWYQSTGGAVNKAEVNQSNNLAGVVGSIPSIVAALLASIFNIIKLIISAITGGSKLDS